LVEKKYFRGNLGTYEIGGAPSALRPRVLLVGEIPQNTHRNKKGGVYQFDSRQALVQK
jgi:hypothetical protein